MNRLKKLLKRYEVDLCYIATGFVFAFAMRMVAPDLAIDRLITAVIALVVGVRLIAQVEMQRRYRKLDEALKAVIRTQESLEGLRGEAAKLNDLLGQRVAPPPIVRP